MPIQKPGQASPKSASRVKSKGLTPEQKLELGDVPEHFPKAWLGRDPEQEEVYADHYIEDPYHGYHDWPFRCEGAVFHNRKDLMNFAWTLSRNQAHRDVWVQTPNGFPEPVNWWDEERLQRDGDWTPENARRVREVREGRLHQGADAETFTQLDDAIPEPSRAEANGRRRAYWDPKLKKVVKTDEFLEPDSPNRRRKTYNPQGEA